MPSTKSPELVVIERQGDNLSAAQIIYTASSLSDVDILAALASLPELREGRPSRAEAVNALVAQQILDSGIHRGAPLVLPTASLISRNIRGEYFANTATDDGALWRLRKDLAESDDRFQRISTGVTLGDRATHYAAGIGGGYLERTMQIHESFDYCRRMALGGYETALELARMMHNTISRVIEATIPVLMERFEDVVRILRELFNKRSLETALVM